LGVVIVSLKSTEKSWHLWEVLLHLHLPHLQVLLGQASGGSR
jgi:hypothetical protein